MGLRLSANNLVSEYFSFGALPRDFHEFKNFRALQPPLPRKSPEEICESPRGSFVTRGLAPMFADVYTLTGTLHQNSLPNPNESDDEDGQARVYLL